jgi:hypothetical protein
MLLHTLPHAFTALDSYALYSPALLYFVDVDNVALSSELKYIKGGNFLLTF